MSETTKVVIITGASSGIGRAIGAHLVSNSYTVYGTSRDPKTKILDGMHMLPLDITKRETIRTLVNTVVSQVGRIDYLVNNAGMGITGPLEETPEDQIRRVFETNYFGTLEMIYRMELMQFNIKMTTVAPGDFATNIAAGRYHAPIIKGSAYEEAYANTLKLMDAHVDSGMDTQIMAKVVYRIMQSKNPKVHYRVGFFMQKFSIVLKRLLPDTWYEKLLLNHYKL